MRQQHTFLKTVGRLAIPVTLQSMIQSSFSVIDQVMIGQIGSVNIAGVGLAGKFLSVFNVLVAAVAAVEGIMLSQYMGKEDKKGVDRSFSVSVVMAVTVAVLFCAGCILWPDKIMSLYTTDGATWQAAASYLRITAIAFVPSAGTQLLSTYLRCMEKAVYPLYASFASMLLNTGLNYLLIFGRAGLPELGIAGAAMATTISQTVNCAVLLELLYRMSVRRGRRVSCDKPYGVSFVLSFDRQSLTSYGAILIPMLVTELLWVLGENVYGIIYGHMGTADCAAMTLTNPVQNIVTGMLSGISQAAGIIVGKTLGSGEYEKAYLDSKKLMLYGLCGSICLSLLLLPVRSSYVQLYQVEAGVQQTAVRILGVYAFICNVKVQNMVLGGGILRSGGKTKYVMYIDIIGTWVFGVPLGLLAAFVWELPIAGVYLLLSLEECIRLIISLVVFRRKRWMKSLE